MTSFYSCNIFVCWSRVVAELLSWSTLSLTVLLNDDPTNQESFIEFTLAKMHVSFWKLGGFKTFFIFLLHRQTEFLDRSSLNLAKKYFLHFALRVDDVTK